MKLNNEQSEKLFAHLNKSGQTPHCSVCNGDNWGVSDTIFELNEFRRSGLALREQIVYPIIPVTCLDCGYTMFINPVIIGIIDPHKVGGK